MVMIYHGTWYPVESVKKSPSKQIRATNDESCCWITQNTLQVLHVFTHVLRQLSGKNLCQQGDLAENLLVYTRCSRTSYKRDLKPDKWHDR